MGIEALAREEGVEKDATRKNNEDERRGC